jgi:hypothetical protein
MALLALRKVFASPLYILLALVISIAVFALVVWLPNLSLIIDVMGHPGISLAQKIALPLSLLGAISTNFSTLSATYTILIAILFGINIAMLVYFVHYRVDAVNKSGVATGFLGMFSGILGVGCAACGSLILMSLLASIGATGALTLLPLAGGEFGILGVILLAWSVYALSKRIEQIDSA